MFGRIFMLFWIAMALIVGASIAITYTNAAREYELQEFQRRPAIWVQASEVLGADGLGGLRRWLNANTDVVPDREVFIVGPDGADILGRRLSDAAQRRPAGQPPLNFRPRQAPQILAGDGTVYTIVVVPRRPSLFGALSRPGIPLAVLGV